MWFWHSWRVDLIIIIIMIIRFPLFIDFSEALAIGTTAALHHTTHFLPPTLLPLLMPSEPRKLSLHQCNHNSHLLYSCFFPHPYPFFIFFYFISATKIISKLTTITFIERREKDHSWVPCTFHFCHQIQMVPPSLTTC